MRAKLTRIALIGLISTVFAGTCLLYAGDRSDRFDRSPGFDRRYYRYYDHPGFGLHIRSIPYGCYWFSLGDTRYYYYDGLYYSLAGSDYVIVNPPAGAVVNTIPEDFNPVTINGVTYYADNGIYYIQTSGGFKVVPSPIKASIQASPSVPPKEAAPASVEVVSPSQASVAVSPDSSDETIIVNVKNSAGAIVPVVLKRTDKGFLGPNGEIYPDFPKLKQLQALYGR